MIIELKIFSPYIIHPIETFDTEKGSYIVMEYVDGIELYELYEDLLNSSITLSNTEKLELFSQIASGLSFLHKHNIVHLDIKLQNIMLTNSKQIKIVDFGFACLTELDDDDDEEYIDSICGQGLEVGSPRYKSPELFKGIVYEEEEYKKSDVYSLGVIFYEIWSEQKSYKDARNFQDVVNMKKNKHKLEGFSALSSISNKEMKNLISSMLNYDLEKRPSMSDVLIKIIKIQDKK